MKLLTRLFSVAALGSFSHEVALNSTTKLMAEIKILYHIRSLIFLDNFPVGADHPFIHLVPHLCLELPVAHQPPNKVHLH